jgi:hypothetical protein
MNKPNLRVKTLQSHYKLPSLSPAWFSGALSWFSGALSATAKELRNPGMKGLAFGFNWNDPSMVL